ncbi:MAG: hypothetical protein QM504_12025 [Pseudomonadota bacterium]
MSTKSIRYKHLITFLGVISLLLSTQVLSEVLILSPNNVKARSIAVKIKEKLIDKNIVISENPNAVENPELVITLGSELLKTHGKQLNAPTIASFVSPSEYFNSNILNNFPSEPIYSVVSPRFLMSFLEESFGNARVGYIYVGEKDPYIKELEFISSFSETKIVPIKLRNNDVFKTIRRILSNRSIDVMIVSNNSSVFNRKNIRFVLEALYRKKIPTVGLSQTLVDAGAVAAVFSKEDAIIEQTISSANSYLLTNSFRGEMYALISDVVYKKAFVDEFNIPLIGNYTLK